MHDADFNLSTAVYGHLYLAPPEKVHGVNITIKIDSHHSSARSMAMRLDLALVIGLASGAQSHASRRTTRVFSAREPATKETYDFVIVGGGVAGLTVADRLSENANGIYRLSFL